MSDTGFSTPRAARRAEWGVRLHELPLLVGLVLLWTMLWHEVSLLSVVSGIVVAVVVMRVFYLPPVELAGRFNVWYALLYLGSRSPPGRWPGSRCAQARRPRARSSPCGCAPGPTSSSRWWASPPR
jgi:hypothetical protein